MPGQKVNYFHCVLCSKRTKPAERRSINKVIKKYLRRKFLIEAPDTSVMCNKCRHIYRNESATGIILVIKVIHVQCQHLTNRKVHHLYPCHWLPQQRLMPTVVYAKNLAQS